jgi:hypothetical protein
MTTDLQAIHTTAKSFYGKAKITIEPKRQSLISYTTIVAFKEGNKLTVKGWHSVTTAKHINEFLMQHGATKLSKKEMDKNPTITLT